jgi:thiosulfate reductase cytochrome b subunit
MYSIGQTAVASIPPATHPAVSASIGCFFFCLLVLFVAAALLLLLFVVWLIMMTAGGMREWKAPISEGGDESRRLRGWSVVTSSP